MITLPPLPLRPLLHAHYLNMRALWGMGDMPRRGVQHGFEGVVYGVLGKRAWRPTHISPAGVRAVLDDWPRRGSVVQRAHGVLPGRVDRSVRMEVLMVGAELRFEEWWRLFVEGDSTVLITRGEHVPGRVKSEGDLIRLPPPEEGLFLSSGFGVAMSARREGVWLRAAREELDRNL